MAARALSEDDFDDDQDQMPVRRGVAGWIRAAVPFLCWLLALLSLAYAVVRVFGLERTWPVTVFMAFTPYVTILSLVPLLFAVLLRRWRAAVVALVAAFALVSVMIPRVVGGPDRPRGPALRLMSSNMYLGTADANEIVSLARSRQVDVLALQEYTRRAEAGLTAAGIDTLFPYSERDPRDGPVGSAIYSRYPLTDTGFLVLPTWFGQAYATVHVPGAVPIAVMSVHPPAPASPSILAGWAQGLERLPPASPNGPVRLLLGDFNATLDFAHLRTVLDTGYEDVAAKLGDGLTPTWPYAGAKQALVPKVTLDHVLVDPRIGVSSYNAVRIRHTDHKAIFASVTLPRG